MKVYGSAQHEITIDPIDVIESLIKSIEGPDGWITEQDGRYYRGYEQNIGPHSIDKLNEITKVEYDYHSALTVVLKQLRTSRMLDNAAEYLRLGRNLNKEN